jgi:hypothetical protein
LQTWPPAQVGTQPPPEQVSQRDGLQSEFDMHCATHVCVVVPQTGVGAAQSMLPRHATHRCVTGSQCRAVDGQIESLEHIIVGASTGGASGVDGVSTAGTSIGAGASIPTVVSAPASAAICTSTGTVATAHPVRATTHSAKIGSRPRRDMTRA